MKLVCHRSVTGQIHLISGLHIGGASSTIEIGGMDNPVVRSALDELPYIPGSSLKGKMRSLLEWKYDKSKDGQPCQCRSCSCYICRIFGTPGAENNELGPTRIIVRDAHLSPESKNRLERMRQEKGLLYAEEKYENSIDRFNGVAKHPRPIERIPAGIDFDFEIVLRVFDVDDEHKMLQTVREAMRLLELDALGGMGSRGYGKVAFQNCKLDGGQPFDV